MTRTRVIGYAALATVEVAYILHANLPSLLPPPPCGLGRFDVCIFLPPAFPWVWMALAVLLTVSAIAILLRKRAALIAGLAGQALVLPPFLRDIVYNVGSFLFTGSGYSGVDPSYRDLAFIFLALSVVIGPALALLFLMSTRTNTTNRRAARVAALLLSVQLATLIAVAVIVFRATYQDCEHNGPGTPIIDGVPGCPDYADLDVGSLVATLAPSTAVLLMVCVGVWRRRPWALAGGIVWQVLLAVALSGMGVALFTGQNQNAWYDHFPVWTSPRQLAYALLVLVPVPTLAALLAARTTPLNRLPLRRPGQRDSSSRTSSSKPGAEANPG